MRLLVTRPLPDAERTAATLRARGHEVMVGALMRIELLPHADLGAGPWAGVLLTSANAVRALAEHARRAELMLLPAFAVGERTAQAAKDAGLGDVVSANGNAEDLARLVAAGAHGLRAPLLYLAGEDRAADIAAALAARGVRVETAIVYRAVAATHLPPLVWSALSLGRLDGVLHFSRRSAETYVKCAKDTGVLDRATAVFHYCLSPQVAQPLEAAGASKIRIARRPDEAALIELTDAEPPASPPRKL
jgi:uroporphyrinogen-III synthase